MITEGSVEIEAPAQLLGALVGRLMINKTKRFLELEAQGLKARSEQLSRSNGPHA